MTWDKTDHTFLSKDILQRYHRRLGDVLIEKNLVQPKQIIEALKDIKKSPYTQSLGRYLLDKGSIEEFPLAQAIAEIKQSIAIVHINLNVLNTIEIIQQYDENELIALNILPLIETQERILFASDCNVSQSDLNLFARKIAKQVDFIYTTHSALNTAFIDLKSSQPSENLWLKKALESGVVMDEQVLIAMNQAYINSISLNEAFEQMGIFGLERE